MLEEEGEGGRGRGEGKGHTSTTVTAKESGTTYIAIYCKADVAFTRTTRSAMPVSATGGHCVACYARS